MSAGNGGAEGERSLHEQLAMAVSECEVRRGRTWGTAQWSVVHVPTGEVVSALPEPIITANGPVVPGIGARFFRLKREAVEALEALREAVGHCRDEDHAA